MLTSTIRPREKKCNAISAVLLVFVCCVCIAPEVLAQYFERAEGGSLVTDGGASRSVNWVDYNNDGLLDLFVSNGLRNGQSNFLYRNEGPPFFIFTKIFGDPVVSDNGKSDGSSWADYDNDGDLDAFVVNWYNDNNLFYSNNGDGTFTQITSGPPTNDRGYSETCSWGDYDNDGWLDLFVTNSGDVNATGPRANFLYHNNGSGEFVKIVTGAIVSDLHYSRGVNWIDFDGDGDLDVFVTNEENQNNALYRNRLHETGTADFEKIAASALTTDMTSSWSGSWGDYDNDGDLDVFVANWGNQNNALYRNEGSGVFSKIVDGVVIADGGYSASSGWGDFDNDGDLDLYVTNAYGPGQLSNFLYMNLLMDVGEPLFQKITGDPAVSETGYSYGFGWGDYDNDGDLDLFVARTLNENQNNAFYINQANHDSSRHWLKLQCRGVTSNRSAIGARVRVKAQINGRGVWQMREISGQSGYCGQNLDVHFGLGDAGRVDSLIVHWPSGAEDLTTGIAVDQFLQIHEGDFPTAVKRNESLPPSQFNLRQNYPNPFSGQAPGLGARGASATRIEYLLPQPSHAKIQIANLAGQVVRNLVDAFQPEGLNTVSWDGKDDQGIPAPSGIYFYKLSAPTVSLTRKMMLVQ